MATADTTDRRIADRYVLIQSLGKGGMGTVWRAHDTLLNRTVAIKQIEIPRQLEEMEAQAVKARAMREARSAARLAHPAVVTIYDVLQEENQSFIVMEFIDASTLEDVVKQRGDLPPEEAARVGLDVLDALETAHAHGIVHRDVKPSNVMITDDGRAKLADFGIATVKDDPKLTSTGMILGSPQFMAPEQAQGTSSGPATDLWALGATLYFAVEGRYPFDRGEAIPTLAAVVHDDFSPMRRAGWLAPIISSLMDKRPEHRPTAGQLRRLLISEKAGAETRSTPASETAAKVHPPIPDRRVHPPIPNRRPARNSVRLSLLPAVVALLVICGAIGAFFLLRDDPSKSGTQPPGARNGSSATEDTGTDSQSTGNAAADDVTDSVADVPAPNDWATYRDPGSGYRLKYPSEWDPIQDAPNSIDFRDPDTGTYLRVQWTTSPGSSPEGAWETQAESFAAGHEGYQEIGITPTTYRGYDAAVWEFIYSEGGARLHAADLGFVIGDDYGFALYFQTHEEDWAASQQLFEQLKSAFRPPSV
jgi:eukaryotic-like serine/threonine-protein kinase